MGSKSSFDDLGEEYEGLLHTHVGLVMQKAEPEKIAENKKSWNCVL